MVMEIRMEVAVVMERDRAMELEEDMMLLRMEREDLRVMEDRSFILRREGSKDGETRVKVRDKDKVSREDSREDSPVGSKMMEGKREGVRR